MIPETAADIAADVRKAVDALNVQLQRAAKAKLRVDLSVQENVFRSYGDPNPAQMELEVEIYAVV